MKKIIILLFLTVCVYASDVALINKTLNFVYFKNITALDMDVYLSEEAKKVLNEEDLKKFAKTTLRAKIGKPLNKLKKSNLKYSVNIWIQVTLNGPYNENLDIYNGIIELFVANDSFGREKYRIAYFVANHKNYIEESVKKRITLLLEGFVQDYYDIIDYDLTSLPMDEKLFFLFSFRQPMEYFSLKMNVWNSIKESQSKLEKQFNNIESKLKKVSKYGSLYKTKDKLYYKLFDTICIDSNKDGKLDKSLEKHQHNIASITLNEYYFENKDTCSIYIINDFSNYKKAKSK